MSTAVLLFGYALLLGTAGAHALAGAAWADRAPRLGIAAWQALSASVIAAVALSGMVLTISDVPLGRGLAELLQACAAAIQAQYATPGGAVVGVLGSALAAVTALWTGYCLVRELILASRERRSHRQVLALIGRRESDLGVVIVEHEAAAAYCLPGRPRQIVLTSSALAALDPDQVTAVLAHERAHLRGRHHLVLAGARGLRRAIPFLPCFGLALRELPRLVEMLADDRAGRDCQRLSIATALVALADGPVPPPALSAGGPTAAARVGRLVGPARPLGLVRTALGGLCLIAAVAAPFVVALAPALAAAAAAAGYCPIGSAIA